MARGLSGASLAASVRTIPYLLPVFGPGLTPSHHTPAGAAQLAGQALLIAAKAARPDRLRRRPSRPLPTSATHAGSTCQLPIAPVLHRLR